MTTVPAFFTEMERYIEGSRKAVAEAKDFDLTGLDGKIDALCNMILELSQEERILYEVDLQNLLGNLNALGNEMRDQFSNVQEIPQHRKASIAYQTADSRDNFGNRDEEE